MNYPIEFDKATLSCRTSQLPRPRKLHSHMDRVRPAGRIFAWKIAFPLLFLLAALMLVQPCTGAGLRFFFVGDLLAGALLTPPPCWPTARYSWSAERAATSAFLRARSFTIRQPELGVPPAASTPRALSTPPPRCLTARYLLQEVAPAAAWLSRARNSMIQQPALGPTLVTSTPHVLITRLHCWTTARC
jgi:hypothetical protein